MCSVCGKEFTSNTSGKVCSDCRKDKACEICGKSVNWRHKYCSRKCSAVGFANNKEAHEKISSANKGRSTWDLMSDEQRRLANEKRKSNYTEEWRKQRSLQASEKMTDEIKHTISRKMREYWNDNKGEKIRRSDMQKELYLNGFGDDISKRTALALSDLNIRKKMSDSGKARWKNMSEEELNIFSEKCSSVWTDDKKDGARERTSKYQSSLTDEERTLQNEKRLKYWTYERRLLQSEWGKNNFDVHDKIREWAVSNFKNMSNEERVKFLSTRLHGGKSSTSRGEEEVIDFVKTITNDGIILRDRTILDGEELDILIPSVKLAIEYNGSFYHSVQSIMRKKNCTKSFAMKIHQSKSLRCSDKGIRLIHIWDWEWDDFRIRERIKSQICGVFGLSERVFARKCSVEKLTNDESSKFFSENSEFGNKRGIIITFGLKYNGKIVMAYGVSYKQTGKGSFTKSSLEIARSATALNTVVVGGASRLMKAVKEWAIENHPSIDELHYFVDFDKHSGTSLKAMGGKFLGVTPPSIRLLFNKKVTLVSKLGDQLVIQPSKIYSRMPIFHRAVKDQEELGNVLTIANAGTLHYVFDL